MLSFEEFRDIKNYENYEVSNLGRIRNKKTGRILKLDKTRYGYFQIVLSKNGTIRRARVHRLVAEAFLPNPNKYPEVNHKDEDKTNNKVDNLEWCTHEYNMNYSKSKPVLQFDKAGKFINEYESGVEAERKTGINRYNIYQCCLELPYRKSAGGYLWKYKN